MYDRGKVLCAEVSSIQPVNYYFCSILAWGSWFVSIVSRSRLSISTLAESRSRQLRQSWHFQNLSLDDREISVEIKISWFHFDSHIQSSASRSRSRLIKTYQDLSRLIKIFVIFCDFYGFLDFFHDLDQEIMYFYKYLDRDFSSQHFLLTFCASKLASEWAKSVGNSIFFKKSRQKSRLSRKSMVISIYLDGLN